MPQEHLPDERRSLTHRFQIGERKGYITIGYYLDGRPGEVQIVIAKSGTPERGLFEAFSILVSMGLQYGIPMADICAKCKHIRDETGGVTSNPDIPMANSILDYVFHWLEKPHHPQGDDENG